MKILQIHLLILLFVPSFSYAQDNFQIVYGGNGEETCSKTLIQSSAYSFIGHSNSSGAGIYDILFVQTDTLGNIIHSYLIGAAGEEIALSAARSNDKRYLLTGYTNSFEGDQPFVVKLDSTGLLEWAKKYSLHGWAYDIVPSNDGSFLLTGYAGLPDLDIFLMKIDSAGIPLWIKSFGDSLINQGRKVIQTHDSGILICGTTYLQAGGPTDLVVIKTDSAGNLQWSYRYGDTGWDNGLAIAESGSDILIGSQSYTDKFNNSPNSADILILRLDSTGMIIKTFVTGSSDIEVIRDIAVHDDAAFSITGASNHWGNGNTDLIFATFDTSGQILTQQVFGGSSFDQGLSVCKIGNHTFLISGYSQSFGAGINDMYFIKTDAAFQGQCNNSSPGMLYSDITISRQAALSYIPISASVSYAPFTESPYLLAYLDLCPSPGIPENENSSALIAFPNPFSLKTTLSFSLFKSDNIHINLYDLMGRKIKEIINENFTPGDHQVILNAAGILSGIYFCELKTAMSSTVIKIVLQ